MSHFGSCSYDFVATKERPESRFPVSTTKERPEGRSPLVSIKAGVGYDHAYPTKVLSTLACGTPVIYAGPGPAREDIGAHCLGICVDYSAISVAKVFQEIINLRSNVVSFAELRQWVLENKSLAKSSQKVAQVLKNNSGK